MAYKKVQFIAYCIYTGPAIHENGKQKYIGLPDGSQDTSARLALVKRAMELAHNHVAKNPKPEETLKVLMLPEFFFRGVKGAYPFKRATDTIDPLLNEFKPLTKDDKWRDWLFIFSTILCQLDQAQGQPDKTNIVNFALVQKGGSDAGEARIIPKVKKTDGDFIKKKDAEVNPDFLLGESVIDKQNLAEDPRFKGKIKPVPYVFHLGDLCDPGQALANANKNLTLGLEICGDHQTKLLKKGLFEGQFNPPFPDPIDIQLITSGGTGLANQSVVARENGYVFQCDGYDPAQSRWPDALSEDIRFPLKIVPTLLIYTLQDGDGKLSMALNQGTCPQVLKDLLHISSLSVDRREADSWQIVDEDSCYFIKSSVDGLQVYQVDSPTITKKSPRSLVRRVGKASTTQDLTPGEKSEIQRVRVPQYDVELGKNKINIADLYPQGIYEPQGAGKLHIYPPLDLPTTA